MNPTELVVVDFDGTLYHSPPSPDGDPTWYFHAKSLSGWQAPGFDSRWNIGMLIEARRASHDPLKHVILLTGRADHRDMRKIIREMLLTTGIAFKSIHLRPAEHVSSIAEYKSNVVKTWLERLPSLVRVRAYDDDANNVAAIYRVTLMSGRNFQS